MNDAGMAILFAAVANNKSLVDLDLNGRSINNDSWTLLCESLKAHPTLTSLDIRNTRYTLVLSDEQKSHRTRLLSEMMKENTVLHTITLWEGERDEKIYMEEISPYLETNRYRPRVVAVKKTTERLFREKVLGRALDCVKSNPNLVWMFLSENVDAFVRSEEEEEAEVVLEDHSEVVVSVAAAVAVAGSKRKR
jgi:hypothetical protein